MYVLLLQQNVTKEGIKNIPYTLSLKINVLRSVPKLSKFKKVLVSLGAT
jgi:hypothetical protein